MHLFLFPPLLACVDSPRAFEGRDNQIWIGWWQVSDCFFINSFIQNWPLLIQIIWPEKLAKLPLEIVRHIVPFYVNRQIGTMIIITTTLNAVIYEWTNPWWMCVPTTYSEYILPWNYSVPANNRGSPGQKVASIVALSLELIQEIGHSDCNAFLKLELQYGYKTWTRRDRVLLFFKSPIILFSNLEQIFRNVVVEKPNENILYVIH